MPTHRRRVAGWDRNDLEKVAVPLIGGRGVWNGGAAPPDDSPLGHAETEVVWKKWRAAVQAGTDPSVRVTVFSAHQQQLVSRLEASLRAAVEAGTTKWFWVIVSLTSAPLARIRPVLESGAFAYCAHVDNAAVVAVPELACRWRDAFAHHVMWDIVDDVRDSDDNAVGELVADMWNPHAEGSASDLVALIAAARRLT